MSKKLKALQDDLADMKSRLTKLEEEMKKRNTNFWNHFGQMVEGISILNDHITALQQANAVPGAVTVGDYIAGNGEAKSYHDTITELKNTCKQESNDYYVLEDQCKTLATECDQVAAKADSIVKSKQFKDTFKKQKTLPGLIDITGQIKTLAVNIRSALGTGPHRSTHAMLQ